MQCCLWSAERGNSVHDHEMDQWLENYAATGRGKISESRSEEGRNRAAGGLGFAFLTFTDAVLESGIKIVLEETRLEEYIREADLVITGEGQMDGQTAMGKAPIGVAGLAKKYGKNCESHLPGSRSGCRKMQ